MAIKEQLSTLILDKLGHFPTLEQREAVDALSAFLLSGRAEEAFLLCGYAGTGKTTLVGALVRALEAIGRKVVLLAPTGRAAKVLSLYAGRSAYTIHKKIYRQKTFSDEVDNFAQNVNLHKHTLFLVDEASMIANEGLSGGFGTGRLLDDLVQFVYSGEGCRLLLVGDAAQLPPVGEVDSPALSEEMLKGYGLSLSTATLTEVVRQIQEAGVLWNATELRQRIMNEEVFDFPRVRLAGFPDVKVVPGDELIECLEQSYSRWGTEGTQVITRSNRRANIYNQGIRARILGYEEELTSGDRLMITKNNYHWVKEGKENEGGMSFVANGDVATVVRYRRERSLYGFRFADVVLRFTDFDDYEVEAAVLLDTLQSEAPSLPHEQSEQLFQAVWDDYPELTRKRDRMKAVKEDAHYNALQVKYSYAITCHKAQGGQWEHVYLDQGYVTEEMLGPDYFRWLYTAFTRATECLYLVNWPKEQVE